MGVGGSRAIMKASVELAFGLPMSWPIGCKRGEQERVSRQICRLTLEIVAAKYHPDLDISVHGTRRLNSRGRREGFPSSYLQNDTLSHELIWSNSCYQGSGYQDERCKYEAQ